MLTRLCIRNFKRLDDVSIELGRTVVLIGPNNSGKTTALQALTLWDIGLRKWDEKRGGKEIPTKRSGVSINRRDLSALPVPSAKLLWRDLYVRNVERPLIDGKRSTKTQYIRIEITVDGVSNGVAWSQGLEFDYANDESIYCRPLGMTDSDNGQLSPLALEALKMRVVFLPPMSGLSDREFVKEPGEIGVLIGQGQTAQVLRNLCYQLKKRDDQSEWQALTRQVERLFGVKLLDPEYIVDRSEIVMQYEERGTRLDLSCAGRGLQQTLLLLAHLALNPHSVLLLDEPDAHLEILRQRQNYRLINEIAERQGSQIIIASHSEVILNEAADRDVVIAFVGQPHRIDDRGAQVLKALRDLGFEQYLEAEQTGWVLYLEDSTDFDILRAFAETLNHPVREHLERPFLHYVATNLPQKARDHFYGLCEAKTDLRGVALFDRLDRELQRGTALVETMWRRREIENYFCSEAVLLAYARHDVPDDLFGRAEGTQRTQHMRDAIQEVSEALETLGKPDPWSHDIKVSDEFLAPVFKRFFEKLKLPLTFRKSDYHFLARLKPAHEIDPEVIEKLDLIQKVAESAVPRR